MGGSGESLNEILSQYDDVPGKHQGTVLYLDHVQLTFFAFYCDLKMIKKNYYTGVGNSGKIWNNISSHIQFIMHTFHFL